MRLIDADELRRNLLSASTSVNAMGALDRFTDTKMREQWTKAISIVNAAPTVMRETHGSVGECFTCLYWHCETSAYLATAKGECRCHALALAHDTWPVTRGRDWCGEWRRR